MSVYTYFLKVFFCAVVLGSHPVKARGYFWLNTQGLLLVIPGRMHGMPRVENSDGDLQENVLHCTIVWPSKSIDLKSIVWILNGGIDNRGACEL